MTIAEYKEVVLTSRWCDLTLTNTLIQLIKDFSDEEAVSEEVADEMLELLDFITEHKPGVIYRLAAIADSLDDEQHRDVAAICHLDA